MRRFRPQLITVPYESSDIESVDFNRPDAAIAGGVLQELVLVHRPDHNELPFDFG